MTDKQPNIYQRINQVRRDVNYVRKDITVQGYMAVSHDMVTAALRDSLIENGIIIVSQIIGSATIQETGMATSKGTPIIRYEARFNIAFISEDNPADSVTQVVEAHANDMGDKAPGKALSYAAKYACLKLFSLETGEDDESRIESQPPTLTNEHLLELRGRAEALGMSADEAMDSLAVKVYRVKTISEIPDQWFEDAMQRLDKRHRAVEQGS